MSPMACTLRPINKEEEGEREERKTAMYGWHIALDIRHQLILQGTLLSLSLCLALPSSASHSHHVV